MGSRHQDIRSWDRIGTLCKASHDEGGGREWRGRVHKYMTGGDVGTRKRTAANDAEVYFTSRKLVSMNLLVESLVFGDNTGSTTSF